MRCVGRNGWRDRQRSRSRTRTAQTEDLAPFDKSLFEELKKVRLTLARENGNLPAYLIFPDETLRAFARLKPRSIEAGRQIRGVGDLKAKKYLPAFLEAIAKHEATEIAVIPSECEGPHELHARIITREFPRFARDDRTWVVRSSKGARRNPGRQRVRVRPRRFVPFWSATRSTFAMTPRDTIACRDIT